MAKILWHDGIGLSLYAKRLDRGKFIWPSASGDAVSISAAQMAYMLEGIDWKRRCKIERPSSAGWTSSEARWRRQFERREDENAKLKKLLAEQMLDAAALRELLSNRSPGNASIVCNF